MHKYDIRLVASLEDVTLITSIVVLRRIILETHKYLDIPKLNWILLLVVVLPYICNKNTIFTIFHDILENVEKHLLQCVFPNFLSVYAWILEIRPLNLCRKKINATQCFMFSERQKRMCMTRVRVPFILLCRFLWRHLYFAWTIMQQK